MNASENEDIQVAVDDTLYGSIVDPFVRRFVKTIVRSLSDTRLIDPKNADSGTEDSVFALCFAALASFEDHEGVPLGSERYVAHCAFGTKPNDPDQLVLSFRRTFLHGVLDGEMIKAAIQELGGSN